jgi:paraquat-inducible protein A
MAASQLRFTLALSALLLGLGLFAPVMTLHPGFGNYTGVVKMLAPDLAQPRTFTLFGSILTLLREGSLFIGGLLLIFTVLFPIAKLGIYWSAVDQLALGRGPGKIYERFSHLGKFSMLDLLVVALLVIAIKGLPGGTSVILDWAAPAFCASILLTLYFSSVLKTGPLRKPDKK